MIMCAIRLLINLILLGVTLNVMECLPSKAQENSLRVRDRSGREVIIYKESHALVIWAGDYQHWDKLKMIEAEAKEVAAALKRHGFEISMVGNPSGYRLRQTIQTFINNYGYASDNRLVIYFAGHGFTIKTTNKGYLVPIDAPNPAINYRNKPAFLKAALDMEQFISWSKQSEAKHILFVFDSCFSGMIFKQRSSLTQPLYIESVMNKPVRQFLTAGDSDQRVPEKSEFTPLFIRALEGEADMVRDGYVTGSELGLFLKQNLGEYTKTQTPQFGTIRDPELDQGDIIFRSLKKHQSAVIPPAYEASIFPREPAPLPPPQVDSSSKGSSIILPKQDNSTMLISSFTGVDYSPLQKLLSQKEFRKADEITFMLMLKSARYQNRDWTERDWLDGKDISLFSCQDLKIVDSLWSRYSSNKLGLGIQLKIWTEVRNNSKSIEEAYSEFARRVQWILPSSSTSGSTYISSTDIRYTNPPLGHLPTQLTYPLGDGWTKGGSNTNRHLLYLRFSECVRP